jgi:hypothetical protein
MKLHEYFDVDNVVHQEAFNHLVAHGIWSQAFYAELADNKIRTDYNWRAALFAKLADAWRLQCTNQKEQT